MSEPESAHPIVLATRTARQNLPEGQLHFPSTCCEQALLSPFSQSGNRHKKCPAQGPTAAKWPRQSDSSLSVWVTVLYVILN